jgi:hypothetical protein
VVNRLVQQLSGKFPIRFAELTNAH